MSAVMPLVGVELVDMTCGQCGIPYAIPEKMRAEKQLTGGDFYCPNGHCRTYKKTEVDRLREKLDEQTREATRQAQRALAAETGRQAAERETQRLKKRAKAGVCPCCHRSFVALARHVKTKHPEFAK